MLNTNSNYNLDTISNLKSYIDKGLEIIQLYQNFSNNLADHLFNIQSSILMLKGALIDFQEKKAKILDIHNERDAVVNNLAHSMREVKMIRYKIDSIRNVDVLMNASNQRLESNQLLNNLDNIVETLENLTSNLADRVIQPLNRKAEALDAFISKEFNVGEAEEWYLQTFAIVKVGFQLSRSNLQNINKIELYFINFKKSIGIEMKVKEIVDSFEVQPLTQDISDRVDLDFLFNNPTFLEALFDEFGNKIKNPLDPVTPTDIDELKKRGIKYLYRIKTFTKDLSPSDYTICIIDDDVEYATLIQDWLKSLEFKVIVHNEPVDALDIVRQEFPDLLLLDINMPNLDGITFLERLNVTKQEEDEEKVKLAPAKFPVIMLSSMQDEKLVRKAVQLNAFDYVSKGQPLDYLISKILNYLNIKVKNQLV